MKQIKLLLILFTIFIGSAIFAKQDEQGQYKEFVYGNKDSNITVYYFFSFSCGHCARAHEDVFEKLKTEHIDTNDIKLVLVPILFPNEPKGLYATQSLYYFINSQNMLRFTSAIFKNQAKWLYGDADYKEIINQYLKMFGVYNTLFEKSITANTQLENRIREATKMYGNKKDFNIPGTPAIVVEYLDENNKMKVTSLVGGNDIKDVFSLIKKYK